MFVVPHILQCMRFIATAKGEDRRTVRDYEFDLYMGGERDVYIDNVYYRITKGAMVFRKPGQVVVGYGDYDMYMMTLDFSHREEILPQNYYRNSNSPQQEEYGFSFLENMPTVFFPVHSEELISLYGKISKCSHPNIIDRQLQDSYLTEFLFLLMSDAVKFRRHTREKIKNKTVYIRKACNYINNNYDKDLSVEKIAEHLSLNKNYFIRIFKEELGTTPNQYILESRLFYAVNLLVQSQQSIKDIGELCGFNTPSYFIKCFKQRFGKSPLIYRNEYSLYKK